MLTWLTPDSPFPPLTRALKNPNGLLAAGGDLSVERLVDAYCNGVFPWYGQGDPILWWSPDPRMVLVPGEFKVSRSLAKTARSSKFETRIDTAFRAVITACATTPRDGQSGTWILPEMVEAYCRLHDAGYAHSVETWQNGVLVGGLYGIALDRIFFGESMFSHTTDASKVAMLRLVTELKARGFRLIDCQQATRHLASLGAREIPRREFRLALKELIDYPPTSQHWG